MNQISPKASLYGNIEIGDNVRIDDFCILTGNIKIGNNIHIGCYTFLSGLYGIELKDYAQLSPRVAIFSSADDYSGDSMVGPMLPDRLKPKLNTGRVTVGRHTVLGTATIVMPGITIGEGVATAAFSFVKNDLDSWGIYGGIPAKYLKERRKEILNLQKEFENGRI